MSLIEKVKSRGHWRIVIRPATFDKLRTGSLAELERIVAEAQVRLRGWDYPHTRRQGPERGLDWIRSEDQFGHHLDAWQMFQSGQFAHLRGIGEDWRDESGLWPAGPEWKPGSLLSTGDTIFQYTEIYEFAARLAGAGALGEGDVVVRIELRGLEGRELYAGDSRMGFDWPRRSAIPVFPWTDALTREQVLAESRDRALRAALQLFARFGWDTTLERLRAEQSELRW